MLFDDQTPEIGTDATELETPETPVEQTTENPSEEVDLDIEDTQTEETTEQPSPDPQPQAPEGYVPKDKFVHSARESILNAERAKVAQAQIEQLTKSDTPTDDAMRQVYPEWDDLNEVTKKALIKQEAQEMRQRRIEAQQQEFIDRQRLEDELETVIDSNPKLSGREAEFKRFAKNPKNKGISAEVLAKAFLFDAQEDDPASKPAVPKTEVLPQGSGGSRDPIKPKKISLEEAAQIRKTDYERYRELVKNNMIDDDIE